MKAQKLLLLLEQQLSNEDATQLLDYGVKTNQVDMVNRALDSYQIIGNLGSSFDYYFFKAIREGSIDVVKLFLDRYMDPNSPAEISSGEHPLQFAVGKKQFEIAKLLIEHGADVNLVDRYGYSPIHTAARTGNVNTVKLLIDNDVDIQTGTSEKNTPLHFAASGGDIGIIEFLIENGADVNARNIHYKTPVYYANRRDVRDTFISYGAADER